MASPVEMKPKYDVSQIEETKALVVDGQIVKLSPVKTAKSGTRYFDGEMSNGKGKKRFVSFDTGVRGTMEKFFLKKEAVSFINCNVRKSNLPRNDQLEIIATSSTKVLKCEKEYTVKDNEDESRELVSLSELSSLSINDKINVCYSEFYNIIPYY